METTAAAKQISYCGLYCNNCKKFQKGKCPGCAKNEKASWCKIRQCGMEKGIENCSQCDEYTNLKDCKKFSNPVSKIFEFIFRSDRVASLTMVGEEGRDAFIKKMEEENRMVIRKK